MALVTNWKTLHKSYTVILSILGAIISIMEIVLPAMSMIQPVLDPATYGIIMFILTVGIGIGRYIKQESVDD